VASSASSAARSFGLDPLAERLMELVKSLPVGSKFPSERELEQRWKVSRPALRTRLRTLESAGLLERRGTGGSFTRSMQPEDIAEVMRIGLTGLDLDNEISFRPVRTALERQAALAAARRQSLPSIALMRDALEAMRAAVSQEELTNADFAFHEALFQASGEPSLRFLYAAMRGLINESVAQRRDLLAENPAGLQESFDLHAEVLSAVESGIELRAMTSIDALIDQDLR
jgi:GntR family transcriptional regulator, transcriptional repressor for pyruvate dehydrogenase complex